MRRRLAVVLGFAAFLFACFTLAPIQSVFAATHAVALATVNQPSILGIPLSTATVLAVAISYFMPLVSALVSLPHWSQTVEGYITLVLATANGFLTEWANTSDASHYDWKKALVLAGVSLAVAIAGRIGLWKKTPLSAALSTFPKPVSAPPPNG